METSTMNVLIICTTLIVLTLIGKIFGGGGDAHER